MIWPMFLRAGVILSAFARTGAVVYLVMALKGAYDLATLEIKPNRIYSTKQAARYLGMDRRDVVRLVKSNKLRARLVNGNYRIPGQSILEFLGE